MRRTLGILAITTVALAGGAPADAATPPRARSNEWIVQFQAGVPATQQRALVRAAGGAVTRDLHLIRALGVRLPAGAQARLAHASGVDAVTPNAAASVDHGGRWEEFAPGELATTFVQSTRADKAWTQPTSPATGAGVAVAVVDTGIAGDLPDFQVSSSDPTSRVIASVVTHPDATTATDRYGHGTHVAGLVAGNGRALAPTDPLYDRYSGTAPQSNLVSVKVSDDHGNSTVMDVIAGLQFVADHGADYGIRVVNLSLGSTVPMSYTVDPLDAAVEAVWADGIVVVAAAGNRGADPDAVSYAPANDPYVITVGAVDDHGTKDATDDDLAPWSGRGLTQDGFAKPDLVAPGAHIVGPLAPDSDFNWLCAACVVDGRYFMLGGTSMAAPIVAGIAADMLSAHPDWTPDQVKGALTYVSDAEDFDGEPIHANMRETSDGGWEVAADKAVDASTRELTANVGLTPSTLLDPNTGLLDPTRASWGRASWKSAADGLRASWGAASWSCVCTGDGEVDLARASWGRASWKAFFGETPSTYGELTGGARGARRR
jgi:serine protease AprX